MSLFSLCEISSHEDNFASLFLLLRFAWQRSLGRSRSSCERSFPLPCMSVRQSVRRTCRCDGRHLQARPALPSLAGFAFFHAWLVGWLNGARHRFCRSCVRATVQKVTLSRAAFSVVAGTSLRVCTYAGIMQNSCRDACKSE